MREDGSQGLGLEEEEPEVERETRFLRRVEEKSRDQDTSNEIVINLLTRGLIDSFLTSTLTFLFATSATVALFFASFPTPPFPSFEEDPSSRAACFLLVDCSMGSSLDAADLEEELGESISTSREAEEVEGGEDEEADFGNGIAARSCFAARS